jgi:hypothetical protein
MSPEVLELVSDAALNSSLKSLSSSWPSTKKLELVTRV